MCCWRDRGVACQVLGTESAGRESNDPGVGSVQNTARDINLIASRREAKAKDETDVSKDKPNIPPQNLEAEDSVLGAMLISERAVSTVAELLRPEDFYRGHHSVIFRAALDLDRSGSPVDVITLYNFLEERGETEEAGGMGRLQELAALVPAASNVEHYARIVRDTALLRKVIAAGQRIAQMGYDHDGEAPAIVDKAEQMLFEIGQSRSTSDFSNLQDLLAENFDMVTRLQESGDTVIGQPSGFTELDKLTTGFHPGQLVIIAARPSMGKSALALCFAEYVAARGTPVALFTLEMSEQEVTQRMVSMNGNIDSQRIRTGRLTREDWERFTKSSAALSQYPIHIDDSGTTTIMEMRAKARRLKAKYPRLGMILVDYIQLMAAEVSTDNRVQEVSQISRGLKVLARDLNVPIIAMSQLNRGVESRTDKRPLLSDLRESGSIEQDADIVMFIYRDDYYQKEESDNPGVAEIIVAKQRNGPVGKIELSFVGRYAKFLDLTR